jgi:hypothetical protein
LLIEEFVAIEGSKCNGRRPIDGLIVLCEPKAIHAGNTHNITEKDVIIIQTKRRRIGMYLLGQAYFSKFLVERHAPKSIKCVAICGKSDTVMEELAKSHGVEVVVIADQ